MKSVLISIQPKWCELIANGKKTIEVRKTRPKIDTPFKCYIYMTAGNAVYPVTINGCPYTCSNVGGKEVIGEFVCDAIYAFEYEGGGFLVKGDIATTQNILAMSCMSDYEFRRYAGEKTAYAWHISDLVIYNKSKELSEFCRNGECSRCGWLENGKCYKSDAQNKINKHRVKRPPQSWCYVEEV